jgi:hypothetical protein
MSAAQIAELISEINECRIGAQAIEKLLSVDFIDPIDADTGRITAQWIAQKLIDDLEVLIDPVVRARRCKGGDKS